MGLGQLQIKKAAKIAGILTNPTSIPMSELHAC